MEVDKTWSRWYHIFPKQTVNGERARGWLHVRRTEVWDCGHTLVFKDYFTEKDWFEVKLRGLHKT